MNIIHDLNLNYRIVISGTFVFIVILVGVFGPMLPVKDPLAMNISDRLTGPSSKFLLGTDEYGRDLFSRIIYGARASLLVGITSVIIASIGGVITGMLAAYFGGATEMLFMRLIEVLLSFPPILLAIIVVGFLGSSILNLILVIGLLYIPYFGRITFGTVKSVMSKDYVEATRSIGANSFFILRKSILPNILSPVIVQASLTMASAILLESGLSFLGLGVQPPTPSWGYMIGEARGYMRNDFWYLFWPSLVLSSTIFSINVFGDALRDVLDPNIRTRAS
jgi:peptide/nickel transport system permease protein